MKINPLLIAFLITVLIISPIGIISFMVGKLDMFFSAIALILLLVGILSTVTIKGSVF